MPPEPEPLPPLVEVELPAVPLLTEPLTPTAGVPAVATGAPALPAPESGLGAGSEVLQPNTLAPKAHKPRPQQRIDMTAA